MKWFWRGLGIGLAMALWPLVLPLLLLAALAAWAKRASAPAAGPRKPDQPITPAPERQPAMLRDLRARELAKVERRNREHLERCFTLDKGLF